MTVLGPNGAGKTTIEFLEGFRMPSDGAVSVLGVDPAHPDENWRARVGVVLQSWRDHARWTPRALLTHLGRYYEPCSTPERTRPYDVEELIKVVGIEEQAEQKIRTLSGGQRRCLVVAVGIIGRPELGCSPSSSFSPSPGSSPSSKVCGVGRRRCPRVFPMCWVGIGMRSALLPDAAAALEIGGSWRTVETVLVLGAWAVAGAFIAPIVLRRMARRQSGSQVEAARKQAVQWVR